MALLTRRSEATFQFNSGIDKHFLQHVIVAPKYVIEGVPADAGGAAWGQPEEVPLQADDTAGDGGPHYKDHFTFYNPHWNEHFSEMIYVFDSKTKLTTTPAYVDSDDSSDIDDSWVL